MNTKVLLVSYACEPDKGSEPGVGWAWAQNLKYDVDIHVITRSNNKRAISENKECCGITFHYFDLYYPFLLLKKVMGVQAYHFFWQLAVSIIIYRLHKRYKYDIIQQLTFGVAWGSSLVALFHKKFIWGPIGGGDVASHIFTRSWQKAVRVREFLRLLTIKIMFTINPIIQLNKERSAVILARTPKTFEYLATKRNSSKCFLFTETFLHSLPVQFDEYSLDKRAESLRKDQVKLVTIGRLIPLKQTALAIETLIKLRDNNVNASLTIVGSGVEMVQLKALVAKNLLCNHVNFINELSRTEIFHLLMESHFMLHFSAREGGAWAIHEACCMAVPVICFDDSGAGMVIEQGLGLKLSPAGGEVVAGKSCEFIIDLTSNVDVWRDTASQVRLTYELNHDFKSHKNNVLRVWNSVLDHPIAQTSDSRQSNK